MGDMKKGVVTKIGDVEVTPSVAQFLEDVFLKIGSKYVIEDYIEQMRDVQDFLTRVLLDCDAPLSSTAKGCIGSVMLVMDSLRLLARSREEGGMS
jgi:hypothetical protein